MSLGRAFRNQSFLLYESVNQSHWLIIAAAAAAIVSVRDERVGLFLFLFYYPHFFVRSKRPFHFSSNV